MSSLELYNKLGFKFILCKADKTPDVSGSDSWKDEYNHINLDQAKSYQQTGRMIGALIPPDIIVLNLNRHSGSDDGIKQLKEIKKKYNIEYSINETLIVTTPRRGHHLYYKLPKINNKKPSDKWQPFTHGIKAPDIELKTHSKTNGYVIAAESPGYNIFSEEIVYLFPELITWLQDCEKSIEAEQPKNKKQKAIDKKDPEGKKLPVKTLRRVLKKISPSHFQDARKFNDFTKSCLAVSGTNDEVKTAVYEWSLDHEHVSKDDELSKKIHPFREKIKGINDIGGVTVGSFIHFLRLCDISQYLINQVVKLDSISNTLIDAENSEVDLPFCDPEYSAIAKAPAAQEFFHLQGNTAAASILEMAMENRVLFSDTDRVSYYFDGNRWIEFNDYYGIIYTIIFRVVKIIYQESEGDKEDNDRMFKCLSSINGTKWKQMTWTEFCYKDSIFHKMVDWDSPRIVETITTIDGVIDFSSGEMKSCQGEYNEYRRSYFGYSTTEIMDAKKPKVFIEFFNSLFPDKQTRITAKYCVAMAISGNAGKRLFQLWQGIGSNGKSTLLETIRNVLGKEKSYKFPAEILLTGSRKENYKAEIAKFQGKYFCYTSEADKGARLSQNIIKDMTGDEAISARELYKAPVEFEATWQIIYAVNDLPAIHGDDYAFNDRLIVVPFNMFFYKDEDKKKMAIRRGVNEKYLMKANSSKKFKQGLYSEKAGIVKWMILNYNKLNEDGGVIPESPECKLKKNSYIEDNDDIGLFLKEICEIDEEGKENWHMLLEDIAEEFREFTGSHKKGTKSIIRDILESHSKIERSVERIYVWDGQIQKKKQARVLKNVRLREIDETKKDCFPENDEKTLIDDIPM